MENRKKIVISIILIISLFVLPALSVAQSYKYLPADMQKNIASLGDVPAKVLPVPVLFGPECKDISPNFGVARATRSHEGQDIMAPKGTPVVSPTRAVVLGIEYGSISGKMVYTANPGGETFYYIHLDRYAEGIAKGQVLEPGDLIGYVGNTGDAIKTAPHLHFQINNKLDIPQDPFLRITEDFTNTQKISFLNNILAKSSDPDSFLAFLKKTFPKTCTPDFIYSLAMPSPTVVAKYEPVEALVLGASTTTASIPVTKEILGINSTGDEVVALQNYLINANAGSNARILKNHGVTKKFGALTKAALIEWQKANNILPATGYYGAKSQAFVAAHPIASQKATVATTTPTTLATKKLSITRELYEGVTGEDVRALQKFLNTNGYIIAETGIGSPGHETGLFGLKTKEAVRKFQIAKKITPAEGNVGPKTVKALLEL
jgi:peptidoglycan hydrolase-like protein with peptidoglycan-binding domain